MNKYSPLQIALLVYAFVIPFQRLFHTSWFKYKFQLPEIVFIFLLIFFVIRFRGKIKIDRTAIPILLFTAWSLISISFHYSASSLLEGLGVLYLLLLGVITAWVVSNSDKDYLILLIKTFIFGVGINCVLAILGLLLLYNGVENILGMEYTDYPILGTVYRMQGFTSHPIMLSNLAICGLLLSLAVFKKYRRSILLVLLVGIGLSLTKSILSGLAAFILVYPDKIVGKKWNSYTLILLSAISILLVKEYLTHFTIPLTGQQAEIYQQSIYWGGEIKIAVNEEYSIYNTVYYQLKRSSFEAFLENPFTGVGGGNSNAYNLEKVKAGLLPESVKNFDPHSSVFGILAEFGIIGFIFITFSVIFIFRIIKPMLQKSDSELILSLLAVFVFIVFESLSADVMNYRHMWLIGGIVYGIYSSTRFGYRSATDEDSE